MSSFTPLTSYSDNVGEQIDDTRFKQQFFVNKRGLFNHSVNPFARPNVVNEPFNHRNVYPVSYNPNQQDQFETNCCNAPANTVVSGKRNEDLSLDQSTFFWTELRTKRCRIPKTTKIIGLDESENK